MQCHSIILYIWVATHHHLHIALLKHNSLHLTLLQHPPLHIALFQHHSLHLALVCSQHYPEYLATALSFRPSIVTLIAPFLSLFFIITPSSPNWIISITCITASISPLCVVPFSECGIQPSLYTCTCISKTTCQSNLGTRHTIYKCQITDFKKGGRGGGGGGGGGDGTI